MTAIAQWLGIGKRYGAVVAVEDVTLALQPGEVTALVGHNGAGKTTLIKLLLGLIRPSTGRVEVLGLEPAGPRGAEARRTLGFLPENVAFHGAMTALELMRFYARLKGCSPAGNAELLERVGIAHAARRRVATYSKGMRQRLGIAQALIGAPKLLLFDEPTSGLDPASRIEVFDTIDSLRAAGATVLVSTHALAEVEQRVDRVAVMHRGQLLAAGSLNELRQGVAADLRVQLRLRPEASDAVAARLPAGLRCMPQDGGLRLELPRERKMEVLRAVAALGADVEDVEISTPNLEALYRELIERHSEMRAAA